MKENDNGKTIWIIVLVFVILGLCALLLILLFGGLYLWSNQQPMQAALEAYAEKADVLPYDGWRFPGSPDQDGRSDMDDPYSETLQEFLTGSESPYMHLTYASFPAGGSGQVFTAEMFRHLNSPVSLHAASGYPGLHGFGFTDELWWGINATAEDLIGEPIPANSMLVEWFGPDTFPQAWSNLRKAQKEWTDKRAQDNK